MAAVPLPADAVASATAGLAHWRAGDDANALIARADQALIHAKDARRPAAGRRRSVPDVLTARRERRQLRRLVTAGTLGTRLSRLMDERSIAETAIVELGGALGYGRCLLVRRTDDAGLTVIAAAGEDAPAEAGRQPVVTAALRRCVRERRTVLGGGAGDGPRGELAVPVYAGGLLWGALSVESEPEAAFDEHDAQLVRSVADHLGTALRTAELYDQLDQTYLGTAEALAAALEAKDSYTADHARSIADLAVAVGRELGLADDALRDLRYGAIFHDIGKIAMPDAILNKPGPLTPEE